MADYFSSTSYYSIFSSFPKVKKGSLSDLACLESVKNNIK